MTTPDTWIILKIKKEDTYIYKVLAGFYGGYLHGDSWRLNSGITKIEDKDDHYLIYGHSGSIYDCHKNAYGTTGLSASIFEYYQKIYPELERIENVEEFVKGFQNE